MVLSDKMFEIFWSFIRTIMFHLHVVARMTNCCVISTYCVINPCMCVAVRLHYTWHPSIADKSLTFVQCIRNYGSISVVQSSHKARISLYIIGLWILPQLLFISTLPHNRCWLMFASRTCRCTHFKIPEAIHKYYLHDSATIVRNVCKILCVCCCFSRIFHRLTVTYRYVLVFTR